MASKRCPRCGKSVFAEEVTCPHCEETVSENATLGAKQADDLLPMIPDDLFAELDVLMDELVSSDGSISDKETSEPETDRKNDMVVEPVSSASVFEEKAPIEESVEPKDDSEEMSFGETEAFETIQEDDVIADHPTRDEKNDAVTFGKRSKRASKGTLWFVLSIVALVLIVVLVMLFILYPPTKPSVDTDLPADTPTTTTVTEPTRDPRRDAWLQSFKGQWVDEQSVGKGDLQKQGGYSLMINDVVEDIIMFDLYSYSGPDANKTASATGIQAVMEEDTLHFEFEDDTLGHAGEGFIQFHDEGINIEVLVDGEPADYSLALNAVFLRAQLPKSDGLDIRVLTDTASLAAAGEPIKEAVQNEDGTTTHTYNGITFVSNAEDKIVSVTVDYTQLENDAQFCYECVDGTMTYDTVKEYFGEAEQDYEELDSQILLLHYPLSETSSVTFVFQSESKLLQKIEFVI